MIRSARKRDGEANRLGAAPTLEGDFVDALAQSGGDDDGLAHIDVGDSRRPSFDRGNAPIDRQVVEGRARDLAKERSHLFGNFLWLADIGEGAPAGLRGLRHEV